MLHPFISTAPARVLSAPLLALSASVHVGLIGAAVWSTFVVHPAHLTERAAAERLQYIEMPVLAARATTTRLSSHRVPTKRVDRDVKRAFELPVLPTDYDLVLPEVVPLPEIQPQMTELEIGEKVDLGNDVLHLGLRSLAQSSAAAARYQAFDEAAVDRMATPDPANPKPRYPSRMRAHGVESRFIVYFVVDTTGVIDTTTMELPPSIEPEFTTAVTEVMVRWHFVPAELAGRHVRQMVMQPFVFQMGENYSSGGRR